MMSTERQTEYPIPTRLNLVIVIAQLSAMFGVFFLASMWTQWWQLGLMAAVFAIVGNSVYSIIHEAEHRMLHPKAAVNDLLGSMMALFFPAPYHLLRQGHICHHRCNRTDDEAFDFYLKGDRAWVTWLKFYSIITGVYWISVALVNVVVLIAPFAIKRRFLEFDRHMSSFVAALNPRYWWYIKIEALCAIALHVAIIVGFGISPLHYFVIYFGFGFTWSAMQYVHHFGTERHVLRGTRNLRVFAPIDWIWLNHNWHLVHHAQPTIPWIYLSRLGSKDSKSRGFLIWHYLRMWRGPRYTEGEVKNRYTGKVVQ